MVIEAGVVAGYVIAWVVGKARRAARRVDAKVDAAMDAALDKLHTLVETKLGAHPVLNDLAEEAATADGQVSDLTRQQLELALTAAARKDGEFEKAVSELLAKVREMERAAGGSVVAGDGSTIFTGDAHAQAGDGGFAFGQVGGDVNLNRDPVGGQRPDPCEPGRSCH